MKKILVTGATGYIGSHTLVELIQTGKYSPISIDSHINSSPEVLQGVKAITGVDVPHYHVDLCDRAATQRVFEQNPDIQGVIHFAALKSVPESVANPQLYYQNNINSLLNLLSCCKEFGVTDIIFSSSCSVYGNVRTLPVSEETPLLRTESPYAYTKQVGEQILQDCAKDGSFHVVALRYFNPVGTHSSSLIGESPANPPTALVPIITQVAAGLRPQLTVHGHDYPTRDGTCIRDYIHVSDLAEAHVLALDYLEKLDIKKTFEIFNLGTGNGVTVLEAIHAFEQVSGQKLPHTLGPRRDGDIDAIYSDSTKAKELLGWSTKRDIIEMMRTAWAWQQQIK